MEGEGLHKRQKRKVGRDDVVKAVEIRERYRAAEDMLRPEE